VRRPATITAVLVTAFGCAALVSLQLAGQPEPAALAKFAASSGFLATAWSVGALRHAVGRIVFAGLGLSMCGDLFLIGQARGWFVAGLVSFLLAHVAYATAFVSSGQDRRWTLSAAVPALVAALLVLAWLGPRVPPELITAVRIYTAAITIMLITAFGARGAGAPWILVAGALMFFVSDLSVAMQRLVRVDYPSFAWGLPLYYAGQTCIALATAPARLARR
jgi:uncharacterized membrane protein YhhN